MWHEHLLSVFLCQISWPMRLVQSMCNFQPDALGSWICCHGTMGENSKFKVNSSDKFRPGTTRMTMCPPCLAPSIPSQKMLDCVGKPVEFQGPSFWRHHYCVFLVLLSFPSIQYVSNPRTCDQNHRIPVGLRIGCFARQACHPQPWTLYMPCVYHQWVHKGWSISDTWR